MDGVFRKQKERTVSLKHITQARGKRMAERILADALKQHPGQTGTVTYVTPKYVINVRDTTDNTQKRFDMELENGAMSKERLKTTRRRVREYLRKVTGQVKEPAPSPEDAVPDLETPLAQPTLPQSPCHTPPSSPNPPLSVRVKRTIAQKKK